MAEIELFSGIISDPDIMGGEAVIKGTRIPASLILGHLEAGTSIEELMDEYDLTKEQILATLSYAAHLAEEKDVHVISG